MDKTKLSGLLEELRKLGIDGQDQSVVLVDEKTGEKIVDGKYQGVIIFAHSLGQTTTAIRGRFSKDSLSNMIQGMLTVIDQLFEETPGLQEAVQEGLNDRDERLIVAKNLRKEQA